MFKPKIDPNKLYENYLNSIMWVYYYYFHNQSSFKLTNLWSYTFDFQPFISDLNSYISKPEFDINNFLNINNEFITNYDSKYKITSELQLLFNQPLHVLKHTNKTLYNIVTSNISNLGELYKFNNQFGFKFIYYGLGQIKYFMKAICIRDYNFKNMFESVISEYDINPEKSKPIKCFDTRIPNTSSQQKYYRINELIGKKPPEIKPVEKPEEKPVENTNLLGGLNLKYNLYLKKYNLF